MKAHEHLSSEDLLEIALEEGAGRGLSRATASRNCTECSRALDELQAELREIRAALALPSAEDERRAEHLAQAVLERTTREDPSWRGDWRVVRRFLRERWSSSLVVRLIAASLLLHLLALPVLAIALVMKSREERSFVVKYELPLQNLPQTEAPVEPRRELVREAEPESVDTGSNATEPPMRPDLLTRARSELIETGAPQALLAAVDRGRGVGASGSVGHLLVARSQRLHLGRFDSTLVEPASNAPLMERALWGELLLDDWALSGRADPRLGLALGRLLDPSAGPGELGAASNGLDAQGLAQHALGRAASYGFPLPGFTATSDPMPAFDRAWFERLGRACAGTADAETSGVVSAWLVWGREHAR